MLRRERRGIKAANVYGIPASQEHLHVQSVFLVSILIHSYPIYTMNGFYTLSQDSELYLMLKAYTAWPCVYIFMVSTK